MAQAKFSIGIDLGTSNSALAFSLLTGEGGSEVLAIPQWDTASTATHSFTLPSFLYLPEEAIATQIRGRGLSCGEWVVGRLAQRKASETPGRVAHSAKSWLCHHAADRSAPFLPWGSDELTQQDKISPVFASALILEHLRAAWDARFAGQGPGFQFDTQEITITVPASFDAAAQRLTLAAVQEAGFPDHTRLLEEPQAAFYRWLEQQGGCDDPWSDRRDGVHHVLVIDVGGGTSDFSLFELSPPDGSRDPEDQAGRGERPHFTRWRQYRSRNRAPARTAPCNGRGPPFRWAVGSPCGPVPESEGKRAGLRRRAG